MVDEWDTTKMNHQDYIRAAIDLADGWKYYDDDPYVDSPLGSAFLSPLKEGVLDALAAQLVRQVDAKNMVHLTVDRRGVSINGLRQRLAREERSGTQDRTMNTIKAIVDSGVLK